MASGDPEFEHAWERLREAMLGYDYPGRHGTPGRRALPGDPAGQAGDPATVAVRLAQWSERKRRMSQADAVTAAWQRLDEADLPTCAS
jgi:hypothetical protein